MAYIEPEDEEEEEAFVYAHPMGEDGEGEEGEEGEAFVLVNLSPEEAEALLNAEEEDDEDWVIRHNAWNP